MAIGVSDISARNIFTKIIKSSSLGKHVVAGLKETIYLEQMSHPLGWLAHWMLKSDEYSIVLTGKRLWDAAYVADSKAIEGVIPIPMDRLSFEQKHPSYAAYELFNEDIDPPALKYLIAKHALYNATEFMDKSVAIKPIRGFYGLSKPLEAGECLPLPKSDLISAIEINRMICQFNMKKAYDRARNAAMEHKQNSIGL